MRHFGTRYDFWSFTLLIVALGLAYCAGKVGPTEAKSILTPSPEIFDFGKVRRDMLVGKFELINTCDNDVEILYVIPACSCESVEVPQKRIRPGESVTGKFTWDATSELGRTEKYFIVACRQSGESSTQFIRCNFTGEIVADFHFEPQEFVFSLADRDSQTAKVTFSSSEVKNFAVKGAESVHPAFSVMHDSVTNEVAVTFDPDKWLESDIEFGHEISVLTNCKRGGQCVLPVRFVK